MSNTVSATFKTAAAANQALFALEGAGFTEKQISLVASDSSIGQSFNIEKDNKAAEGGTIGAATGGLVGAIAAGLTATGTVAIPGVNLVVFGAAIAAAAGAGVGATAGGLAGALIGLGLPEYEAKRYEDEVKDGAVLLVVEADSSERAATAKELFEAQDAHNIAA